MLGPLALVGATVYPSPLAQPIAGGVVIVQGASIVAVGDAGSTPVPDGAATIDCDGGAIVAGLWNSHVHLFERKWADAGAIPAGELEA